MPGLGKLQTQETVQAFPHTDHRPEARIQTGSRKDLLTSGFFSLQEKLPATFLMKPRLRRTICKTFEESLDTCPFQDDPELEKVRRGTASTLFTVVGAARERGGCESRRQSDP